MIEKGPWLCHPKGDLAHEQDGPELLSLIESDTSSDEPECVEFVVRTLHSTVREDGQ